MKNLRDINWVYNTGINDILLTALAMSLPVITGRKKNHILLEGHGREDLWSNIDLSNTVGWFTSMYPVELDASDEDLSSRIIRVKEMLHSIPRNGVGYGALLGYSSHEMPRISFNYLGQFNSSEQEFWSITTNEYVQDISQLNHDSNIINISGGIFDSSLTFSFSGLFPHEWISVLAGLFKDSMEEIIEYLSACTRSYLTPSDVGNIISAKYLDRLQKEKEISNIYLANSLQQGFIYHAVNQGNVDDAYRVQLVWEYHNQLNVELLKKAWELAQQKYETMRLRFAWEEELVQIIDKNASLVWDYIDFSHSENKYKYFENLLTEDRKCSFDLQSAPLFRVYLVKFAYIWLNLVMFITVYYSAITMQSWMDGVCLSS